MAAETSVDTSSTARVTADDARIDRLKELLRSTPQDIDFERVRIMHELYGESAGDHQLLRRAKFLATVLDRKKLYIDENLFVGHPTMAWKISVAAQTYEWDAAKEQFPMKLLPDFVSRVKEVTRPDDTLMVMCRSGGRSAIAANLLAQAGFAHVYNIIDGIEGDTVEDADSIFVGQRLRNGWKNSGCPWTYKLTPDRMLLPEGR